MTFDKQLAIQCAKAIAALYGGRVASNVWSVATDTEALIEEHHDGRFAIIFPGTASAQDWLTDFKFRREPWLEGNVHRGFRAAYESVERRIRERIPGGSEVIVAGHSLGGALATLCAHSIKGLARVRNVFTFGSPRVGNGAFVRSYDEWLAAVTTRVVNAHDPVPYLPPWLFGNRHVSTEAFLIEEGGVVFDRGMVAIARDRTAGMLRHPELGTRNSELISISAHNITSYIRKLEALA